MEQTTQQNEEDLFMQELANDLEYQEWCDSRKQEWIESIERMSVAEIEATFGPIPNE